MPALSAQNLRKSFGPQVVLDGASLSIARGERVGLIGANGTGKSTLAKILVGEEAADEGTVAVRRGLTLAWLPQEPTLDPTLSARTVVEGALAAWRRAIARHANVNAELAHAEGAVHDALLVEQAELDDTIVRLGGWDCGHLVLDMLHRLGIFDVERPVGERSGGERRRIDLARILVARPDVAILDEPTNHLDADTAEWLESHLLHDFSGALVLITHDRYFLETIVDRIVELERGRLTSYDGSFTDYLAKKDELLAHEGRVEQRRQNLLRVERAWLARGPKARSTKQKARIQRAESLEAQTAANAGRGAQVALSASVARQGKTILELRGVALAIGGRTLTQPFDLFVTAGERIGVIGPNGAGKSTLLRTLLGEHAPSAGEIVLGRNTSTVYLDQQRVRLDDDKSIFDDVRGESGSTVVTLGDRQMDLRTYLELFLFDAAKQRQKVGALSGGERARVALAKVLRSTANLLLFDEPTNDLDLPTLAALEELLIGYSGSVLVVTHDRAFLDRIATGILSFEVPEDGGAALVERHAGGYQDYASHQAARRQAQAAWSDTVRTNESRPNPALAREPMTVAKRLTYAEKVELEGLLDRIDAAEKELESIERMLADPALYASRGHEVAALVARRDEAKTTVARLLTRWEQLESRR